MARVLNSLFTLNVLDVLLIERFAEGVAVRGLPPLRMRVRVATATTFRGHEHFTRNESTGSTRGIAGRKGVGAEFEIVVLRDLLGVVRRRRLGLRFTAKERKQSSPPQGEQPRREENKPKTYKHD